ncbi:hypothetical protein K461DRAFT_278110 [Myriangium duriaei CBS 260.36]|uniref:Rhodopsin domain-containing protein n=1 Tax=Myriangium duriaei CBS 260.36 TaxID=1168546 RepID=A0A9P4MHL2_9PEZI|nr:hypothetical protein K461DRAFT_278110 [Myriangium duriaei CBS 260.36]
MAQFWMFFSLNLTVLLRSAIATFFLRIMPHQAYYKPHRIAIMVVTSVFAVYVVASAFIILFQCGTSIDNIDFDVENVCVSINILSRIGLSIMVLTIMADWSMVLIPIIVVARSRLPYSTKVSSLLVIALGALGGIVSIVRIPYNDLAEVWGPQDLHRYLIWQILALTENTIGIMAISLAALRPLLQKIYSAGSRNATIDPESSRESGPEDAEEAGKNVVFLTEFQVNGVLDQQKV